MINICETAVKEIQALRIGYIYGIRKDIVIERQKKTYLAFHDGMRQVRTVLANHASR